VSPPPRPKKLHALSRERLRERTAAELRDYVLANGLAPGTQLPPETELAATLGVSRNVVRQAIASLEGLGMLRVTHGSGTYVADPAETEVFHQLAAWIGSETITEVDYLEVRGIWERAVYSLVMERATPEDLGHLAQLAEALLETEDPAETVARHDRFHQALLRLTGNPFLVTMGMILHRFFWEFGYRNNHVRKPPEARLFEAHRTVVQLLSKRDTTALQEIVDLHLSPEPRSNGLVKRGSTARTTDRGRRARATTKQVPTRHKGGNE
jgi:GntR family transcriptional repressor for pyruvate dehydrogenase complex